MVMSPDGNIAAGTGNDIVGCRWLCQWKYRFTRWKWYFTCWKLCSRKYLRQKEMITLSMMVKENSIDGGTGTDSILLNNYNAKWLV